MTNILSIRRDSSLSFFDLSVVFGICEGPFWFNDGLAPWLCGPGPGHLHGVGSGDSGGEDS